MTKTIRDGNHTIIELNGVERVFRDMRAGMIWDSPVNPAYYCIVGLEDMPEPLRVFIKESEEYDIARITDKLMNDVINYGVRGIYAGLGDEWLNSINLFTKIVNRRNIDNVELIDADFASIDNGSTLYNSLKRRGLVEIEDKSILRDQMMLLTDADKKVKGKYYAVEAFCNVLLSFEYFKEGRK